jgi:hypothetical protein
LFALGLSVYLWNINRTVALPVVVITILSTLGYILGSVFLFFDHHCPYYTPVHDLMLATSQAARRVANWARWIRADGRPGSTDSRASKLDELVAMDAQTSRMLKWIIKDCRDPGPVDIALQAVAGANHHLPLEVLAGFKLPELVLQRLHACFWPEKNDGEFAMRDHEPAFDSAILYSRALSLLIPWWDSRMNSKGPVEGIDSQKIQAMYSRHVTINLFLSTMPKSSRSD